MDLNRAATFLRVVEAGGFTAAAAALGVPTSSVSRSIAKLEDELGVVLLERTTRRVALTDVGRAYFERVRDALVGLDEATAAALDAAREPQGLVRIATPADFAPVLAAVFAQFVRRYPRIRIELRTASRPYEQLGEHADLALAFGKLPDSSLVSRRLGETVHQMYAAPSYLAARRRLRTLADLAHHDAILAHGGGERWELTGPRGVESVQVSSVVAGDHLGFIIEAARAGLGVALLPAFVVAADLGSGALAPVLPRYQVAVRLQLLSAAHRQPHRVTLLRDFFVEHLTTACSGHG